MRAVERRPGLWRDGDDGACRSRVRERRHPHRRRSAHPHATALAMRDGLIIAVGGDAEMAPLIGPKTRVIELAGRAVVPALTDAHAHLYALGVALAQIDLRGCRSPDACAAKLAARRLGPVTTGSWAAAGIRNLFTPAAFPTHAAIDLRGAGASGVARAHRRTRGLGCNAARGASRAPTSRARPRTRPAAASCATTRASRPACSSTRRWSWSTARCRRRVPADIEAAIVRAEELAVAEGPDRGARDGHRRRGGRRLSRARRRGPLEAARLRLRQRRRRRPALLAPAGRERTRQLFLRCAESSSTPTARSARAARR